MNDVEKYVYQLENELANSMGFYVPTENAHQSIDMNTTSWVYRDKQIIIPANITSVTQSNKAEIDFSVAHEFCHMIQDFVFQFNKPLNEISFQDYKTEFQKFFKIENAKITETMFNNFMSFIKESPFYDTEMLKIMKFDNEFYVSGSEINEYFTLPWLFKNIYLHNSTELHANAFATTKIMKKYEDENLPSMIFQDLKSKINEHKQSFPDKTDIRTLDQLEEQIKIRRKIDDINNRSIIKKMIPNITNLLKDRIVKKVFSLDKIDFIKTQLNVTKLIESTENVLHNIEKNHKTPEQIQQLENEKKELLNKIQELSQKYPSVIKLINGFTPVADDEVHLGRLIQTYSSHADMLNNMEQYLRPGIKEFIIDMENMAIYPYYFTRTIEMVESDHVLEENESVNLTTSIDEKDKEI